MRENVSWRVRECVRACVCATTYQWTKQSDNISIVLALTMCSINAAWLWGDPHIVTLDGLSYTYNGIGEYWLINGTDFSLQGRTVRAWNRQQQPADASVFGAFAMKDRKSPQVHVEMNDDRTREYIPLERIFHEFSLCLKVLYIKCIAVGPRCRTRHTDPRVPGQ